MSHDIPVFTFSVSCSEVSGKPLTWDEAAQLIPKEHWICTSHNWWYQGLVKELVEVYVGFEELRYLTEIVAVVDIEQLVVKSNAIAVLIKAIHKSTEPFVRLISWKNTPSEEICKRVDEVRKNITEGKVSRDFAASRLNAGLGKL